MTTLHNSENETSTNSQPSKHTDLSYLKDLSQGDNSFIVEMIDAFFVQTPESIRSIKKALNAKDWPALRGAAHKMKPSMTFIGIKELESVIADIENYAAKEISLELLPDLVNQLSNVCSLAIKELENEKKNFV